MYPRVQVAHEMYQLDILSQFSGNVVKSRVGNHQSLQVVDGVRLNLVPLLDLRNRNLTLVAKLPRKSEKGPTEYRRATLREQLRAICSRG